MTDHHDDSWEALVTSVRKASESYARSKSRNKSRAWMLEYLLSKSVEPVECYVLATEDGRTLDLLQSKTRSLDIGDRPRHWIKDAAETEKLRWNRDHQPKDHIDLVFWRDFYKSQIERINARNSA